ncbi:hypothetical protein [Candidatus Lokiarchaeum ossiferum]|uniref:hypothetical protein n=1 Tax=Candidatus Lokiarchaeum ossiferum TaxID=2951803 RepID=UPI00352F77F8
MEINYNLTFRKKVMILLILTVQFILVSCLFDEISTNYLSNNVSVGGKADILITRSQDTIFGNKYFDESIIADMEQMNSNIVFLPHLYSQAYIQDLKGQNESSSIKTTVCGIDWEMDSKLEEKSKEGWISWRNSSSFIGNFVTYDENLTKTFEIYSKPPSLAHCIISRSLAEKTNYSRNDTIKITLSRGTFLLTIDAIVENQGRLPDITDDFIITNLSWLQIRSNFEGKINFISGYFIQPEKTYDLRNPDLTASNLHLISQNLNELCDGNIKIIFPKLMNVDYLKTEMLNLSIISTITTIMMFTINGFYLIRISKSFYTELIEKLEIIQHKNFKNNFLLRIQPFLKFLFTFMVFLIIILIGVIFGFSICYIFGISHLYSTLLRNFVLMGIMALIGASFQLISSKNSRKILYKTEGSFLNNVTKKLTALGSGMVFFLFLFISFIVPEFTTSMDSSLISLIIDIFILDIFIGLFIIQFMIYKLIRYYLPSNSIWNSAIGSKIKSDLNKKKNQVYQLSIMLMIISTGFIGFMNAFRHMKQEFAIESIKNNEGSDIILKNTGNIEQENHLDMNFLYNIQTIPAIEAVTPIFSNYPLPVSSFSESDNNFGLNDQDLSSILEDNILDTSNRTNPLFEFETIISDYGISKQINCAVIGINRSYLDVIDFDSILWDTEISNQNPTSAINHLFDKELNCFISKSIAQQFDINKMDSNIVLTITNSLIDSNSSVISSHKFLLNVAGIIENLPGFNNFYSLGPYKGAIDGLLVNVNNFFEFFNISQTEIKNYPIERMMISYNSSNPSITFKQTLTNIQQYQENFSFIISEPYTKIEHTLHGFQYNDILFSLLIIILTVYFTIISRGTINSEGHVSKTSTGKNGKLSPLILAFLLGIPISFIMIQMTASIISSYFYIPLKLNWYAREIIPYQLIFIFLISIFNFLARKKHVSISEWENHNIRGK